MSHYHNPEDWSHIKKLGAHSPESFASFLAFDEAALRGKDNAIPPKYRELIAIAVALTTQCPYCIEAHSKAAQQAGATEKEVAETVMIATALRAGGGLTHGLQALKFFEKAAEND
ncbi:carboxymuconolactone decarboxylase family protein [Gordonia sp. (in: high G+C Gram-positive bacteria)]|uniref:carboxymuconolactone decarboxylase family protein n=1 Tax=Gordonia sp. (in: high G+C Gram-positive bacteria) TaxID=84139 RepID=UPI00263A1C3B|nr:carboxymuconolactone decarboxylase family protein [Gordonia sp. (in: high G+C Gram-positive bacteria)]